MNPPTTGPPTWRMTNIQKYPDALNASRALAAPKSEVMTQREAAMGITYPIKAPTQRADGRIFDSMRANVKWRGAEPKAKRPALTFCWVPEELLPASTHLSLNSVARYIAKAFDFCNQGALCSFIRRAVEVDRPIGCLLSPLSSKRLINRPQAILACDSGRLVMHAFR